MLLDHEMIRPDGNKNMAVTHAALIPAWEMFVISNIVITAEARYDGYVELRQQQANMCSKRMQPLAVSKSGLDRASTLREAAYLPCLSPPSCLALINNSQVAGSAR